MKDPEQKKVLKKILRSYFSNSELNELTDKGFGDFKEINEADSNQNKRQTNFILQEDSALRVDADLIITFAEQKLQENKFLELLFSLSQLAGASDEFLLAIYINEKILQETKNKKEYRNMAAGAYLALADLYSRKAYWQLSFNNIKKAKEIFIKQNDSVGIAKCEYLLGTIYEEFGNIKKAKVHFEKSLSLIEGKADLSLNGKVELNLGKINEIQGNFDLALSFFQRALLNFQKLSDQQRLTEIKQNIGMIYIKLGKYETAINNFDQNVSVSCPAESLSNLSITYVSKAYLYMLKNDFSLAEAFVNKALDICSETNDKVSVSEVKKIKGIIKRNKHNYQRT